MKIGFVLLSAAAAPIPSTRVAVLNMLPFLRDAGFDPHIVFEPPTPTQSPRLTLDVDWLAAEGFDIVCFQKVGGPAVLEQVAKLRARGISTAFIVCDVVDEAMARATDATIVVTAFLKSLYPIDLASRLHVVHDGIERPEARKLRHRRDRGSAANPLRAVLVTSALLETLPCIGVPPPWLHVTIVGRYPPSLGPGARLRELQWRLRQHPTWRSRWEALRFQLSERIRCEPWHPDGVYQALTAADLGVIPIETPAARDEAVPDWMVKSENRLTLKMALGLPVVATPIPSYEPVVTPGVDAFFARTPAQWKQQLEALRDPDMREAVGHAARAAVIERYSMAAQARLLAGVFRQLVQHGRAEAADGRRAPT